MAANPAGKWEDHVTVASDQPNTSSIGAGLEAEAVQWWASRGTPALRSGRIRSLLAWAFFVMERRDFWIACNSFWTRDRDRCCSRTRRRGDRMSGISNSRKV